MKKVKMFAADGLYTLESKINTFLELSPNIKIKQITYQMNATGPNRYGTHYSAMIVYEE